MSIQTTQTITREDAISRIKEVSSLFRQRKFFTLSKQTEDDICPEYYYFENQKYIDALYTMFDISTVEYSNEFLEDTMDMPFYRYSMFDNYMIGDFRIMSV